MQIPKFENKPFKPPRRILPGTKSASSATRQVAPSRTVKRTYNQAHVATRLQPPAKKVRPQSAPSADHAPTENDSSYFTIVHRKPSQKKHKVWTGDGYAIVRFQDSSKQDLAKILFYDDSGRFMSSPNLSYVKQDQELMEIIFKSSGLEIQLDHEVDSKELDGVLQIIKPSCDEKDERVPSRSSVSRVPASPPVTAKSKSSSPEPTLVKTIASSRFKAAYSKSAALTLTDTGKSSNSSNSEIRRPRFLPVFDVNKIDNPIIMNSSEDADVDVIIDPLLSSKLRPHQREGVKFMYDCVMSLDRSSHEELSDESKDLTSTNVKLELDSDITGCILADEMGLGKTLMTITLIWTLLKQTPYCLNRDINISQSGVPLEGYAKKILIVCPVTLISNWKNEFKKWLGLNRVGVLTLQSSNTNEMDKSAVYNFLRVHRTYQVLILGYEKLLSVGDILVDNNNTNNKNACSIDLLVCDEGHRLKNQTSKVLGVLKALEVKNKILLSGTPIQNDLTEFHTIIDFINPAILGSYNFFKKNYITPITRARDTVNKYNDNIVEVGEAKSEQLIAVTKKFILRRTNDILNKYLPPKTDIILFCKPLASQLVSFQNTLDGSKLDFGNLTYNSSLGLITTMKKICNSPSLLNSTNGDSNSPVSGQNISRNYNSISSGKLDVLMRLLNDIRDMTDNEKVVIVSNYTQTLDIIENLMASNKMVTCRLDGATPPKLRGSIVSSFNNNPNIFAFLLSAKSGGVGLNLVGASRLILFDNDWNPSIDIQAMSRIHRDGQKRHCYIYRLATTGCIDEKILQRQLMKSRLSSKFLDDGNTGGSKKGSNVKGSNNDDLFNKEDLKDLFTVLTNTPSNTHDLICPCSGEGSATELKELLADGETLEERERETRKILSTWSSARDLQGVIEQSDLDEKQLRAENMKKCLIGYRHINPMKHHNLYDKVVTHTVDELRGAVTFAFIKPGEVNKK